MRRNLLMKATRGSVRQSQHLVLVRPCGRRPEQAGDTDCARQPTIDSGLDEAWCEEGERDRHMDVAPAAGLPCGNGFDCRGAALDLTEPQPCARDRGDELDPAVGADRTGFGLGRAFGNYDIAMASMRGLAPRHGEGGACLLVRIMFLVGQRDCDLGSPDFDAADAGGDQLRVVARRVGSDVSADGIDNDGLDLGRRHPGDRACRLRSSLNQGRGDIVAVPRRTLAAWMAPQRFDEEHGLTAASNIAWHLDNGSDAAANSTPIVAVVVNDGEWSTPAFRHEAGVARTALRQRGSRAPAVCIRSRGLVLGSYEEIGDASLNGSRQVAAAPTKARYLGNLGLARPSADHQRGSLHGVGAEQVQRFFTEEAQSAGARRASVLSKMRASCRPMH
jgi:hypothetical protein